jgi:hypothetical protein
LLNIAPRSRAFAADLVTGTPAVASEPKSADSAPRTISTRSRLLVVRLDGTYKTFLGGASVSGTTGHFLYSVGASRLATDHRGPNGDFENTTLSANVAVSVGGDAILRFIGRGELEHVGTPGQTAFERPDLDAFFARRDGIGGVTFDQQVTPTFHQRAQYSLAVSHQQSTNLTGDPPYTPRFGNQIASFQSSDFPFDTFNNLHRHHAGHQADVRLADDAAHENQLLTFVADWDGERAVLSDRLAATDVPASRDNVGVAVQDQAQWRRIVIAGGARFDHNATFGNATVPRGSIVFVAREAPAGAGTGLGGTRLRAAAGLGIKEPTILQSFSPSPSPFFRGNPVLDPERSRTCEAGIEQCLARDRARLEATWFDNRYRKLISLRTTDPSTFAAQYFNIGLTRARGAELIADGAPARPWRLRAGYTFLASEILQSTAPDNVVFQPGNGCSAGRDTRVSRA